MSNPTIESCGPCGRLAVYRLLCRSCARRLSDFTPLVPASLPPSRFSPMGVAYLSPRGIAGPLESTAMRLTRRKTAG